MHYIRNVLALSLVFLIASCDEKTDIPGEWVKKNKSCSTMCSFVVDKKVPFLSTEWLDFHESSGLSGSLVSINKNEKEYFCEKEKNYFLTEIIYRDDKIYMHDDRNLTFEEKNLY